MGWPNSQRAGSLGPTGSLEERWPPRPSCLGGLHSGGAGRGGGGVPKVQTGRRAAGGYSSAFPKARPEHIPSPREGRRAEGSPQSPRPGASRGRPARLSQAPTPTAACQAGLEGCAPGGPGGHAQSGDKGAPALPRGPRKTTGRQGTGVEAKWRRRLALRSPATGSRPGGRRAPAAACERGLLVRDGPEPGRGHCGAPARGQGAPASALGGVGRGRRVAEPRLLSSPRPARPQPSPPPPPEPQAAREMAPVWPPRPEQANTSSRGARRPRGARPPKLPPTPRAPAGGARCRAHARPGAAFCPGLLTTAGKNREEGRAEPAAISRRCLSGRARLPARPPRPQRSPRLRSKPENNPGVREGGASAVGRPAAPGAGLGREVLRHGANMDAGLLSSFALEAQARPGARRAGPGPRGPTTPEGTAPPVVSGAPHVQSTSIPCTHRGSGQGRAGGLHGRPRVAGDTPSRLRS